MKTITKIFQVLNLLYFIGLLFVLRMASSILAFTVTSIGIGLLLVPILIGFVLTILHLRRNKKEGLELSKLEKFLSFFPIINTLGLTVLTVFALL